MKRNHDSRLGGSQDPLHSPPFWLSFLLKDNSHSYTHLIRQTPCSRARETMPRSADFENRKEALPLLRPPERRTINVCSTIKNGGEGGGKTTCEHTGREVGEFTLEQTLELVFHPTKIKKLGRIMPIWWDFRPLPGSRAFKLKLTCLSWFCLRVSYFRVSAGWCHYFIM